MLLSLLLLLRLLGLLLLGWSGRLILVLALSPSVISPFRVNYDLQNLGGLESGAGQEQDGRRHVTGFNANHVGVLVVAKVWRFTCLVHPWIPDHYK